MLVFHDMRLGGIQRKIVDIIKFHQQHHPNTKIILCLRERQGIFLKKVPKEITIISPNFYTRRFNMTWFTLWLIKIFHTHHPTQVVSFMDLGSIPVLIALRFHPFLRPQHTIGEDILTSKYIYTESFPPLRRLLIRTFYPLAHTILVQTPVQKRDLEMMIYQGKPQIHIISTPNWLPLDFPPKKITPINKRQNDILFVGRIDDQKNLPLFVNIVSRVKRSIPNIKATIIGDGPKKTLIQSQINKLGLQKNITIHQPTLETLNHYNNSKIFLLTSDYEGFPLTLIEAISSGCHPVTRDIPEVTQFFKTNQDQIVFKNEKQAVTIIQNILQGKYSSNYLTPYKNLIIKQQQNYISACIQHFSRPKSAR